MVYKRYVKKNGKLHGPYYYESYRENGKIKKKYIGTTLSNSSNDDDKKPFSDNNMGDVPYGQVTPQNPSRVVMGIAFLILIIAILFVAFHFRVPQQNAILEINLNPRYQINSTFSGEAIVNVQPGDAIPIDAHVNVYLIKNGNVIAESIQTMDQFVNGEDTPVELFNSTEICQNTSQNNNSTEIPTDNQYNDTNEVQNNSQPNSSTTQTPPTDTQSNGSTGGQLTIQGDAIQNSNDGSNGGNYCVVENVSVGYFYSNPKTYTRNLEDLVFYRLADEGNYTAKITIPEYNLTLDRSFTVYPLTNSQSNKSINPTKNISITNQNTKTINNLQIQSGGNSCVQLDSNGTFTLDSTFSSGSWLYFNDQIGLYTDNYGGYLINVSNSSWNKVYNVSSDFGSGLLSPELVIGQAYNYSITGNGSVNQIMCSGQALPGTFTDSNLTDPIYNLNCTGDIQGIYGTKTIADSSYVCPTLQKYSLVFSNVSYETVLYNVNSEGPLTDWRMFGRWRNHTTWDGQTYSTIAGLNRVNYSVGDYYVDSSPAVANGYLYIGADDGNLYQLNATNISQIVHVISDYSGSPFGSTSPVVANGFVYVPLKLDYNVYPDATGFVQLNASDVSQLYAYQRDANLQGILTQPVIYGNTYLYGGGVGGGQGEYPYVYQLDATNVSKVISWYNVVNYTIDRSGGGYVFVSSPAITSGYLYITTNVGQLFRFGLGSLFSGPIYVNVTDAGHSLSAPVVSNGYVYFSSNDGNIYQYDAYNIYKQVAKFSTNGFSNGPPLSSPAVANGYLYVASVWPNNTLYQLDASNISNMVASFLPQANVFQGTEIHTSPTVADGYVYFGTDNQIFWELNASNVSKIISNISFGAGGRIRSSAAVANGYVYYASRDSDGGHIWQLNSKNISWTNGYQPDTTFPQINILYPQNTTYNNIVSTLNYIASDTSLYSCWYSTNGGITNSTPSIGCSNFTGLSSILGSNNWFVFANDTSNNINYSNVVFNVDSIGPRINFTYPGDGNGSILTRNYIIANVTANDSNSGFKNLTINLYNSSGLINSTTSSNSPLYINFTNLVNGTYYINATAYDNLGNYNQTETRTIMVAVDGVPPNVILTSPTNNNITNNASWTFVSTISDNVQLKNATLYIWNATSGALLTSIVTTGATGTSTSVWSGYTLPNGTSKWNFLVYDTSGNYNWAPSNFSITYSPPDLTPPHLTIQYPQNNNFNYAITSLNSTEFDETALSFCWYSLNNGVTNTSFTCNTNITGISSSENFNTWTIYANDSSNNVNSTSVTFLMDTTPPRINFTSPSDGNGSILNRNYIIANVTANDSAIGLKNITINLYNSSGLINSTPSSGSSLYLNFTNLVNENYSLNATAYDYLGNYNQTETRNITVAVVYDMTSPQINILYPQNTSYNSMINSLNSTESDPNLQSCWYSLNNGATNTSFTCNTNITGIISLQGSKTWTIYSNDSFGNLNSSSVTFIVDSISPAASLQITTSNVHYGIENISIIWNSTDLHLSNAYFNITYPSGSLLASSTLNNGSIDLFSPTNLSVIGTYTINLWANDTFGNKNSVSNTFKVVFNEPNSSEGNSSEWRMFRKWMNHTAWDGLSYSTIPGLNKSNYLTGGRVRSSPAISNGFAYIGSYDGNVYQLNATNISKLYSFYTTGGVVHSSPSIADGFLYIGSEDYNIYQLNASNVTKIISTFTTGGKVDSSPAIANGYLYVNSFDNKTYQLNSTNISRLIAISNENSSYDSSPAIANGYIYIGGNDNGYIYQFDVLNISRTIASFKTGGYILSSPLVTNGYIYVGSDDGNVYQLNASNISRLISNYKLSGVGVFSSPALANGYVYVASTGYNIYQLNASNISIQLANYTTAGPVQSSPTVSNGYLYIGSNDRQVYQLNASNISKLITNFTTGDIVFSSPAVANGYIYVGSDDGNVYQLNATNISLTNTLDITPPIVSLIAPSNNFPTKLAIQTFNATVFEDYFLSNMTYYLWNSSNSLINQTTQIKIGNTNSMNLTVNLPYNDLFHWNYQACDASNNCAFSSSNYTIAYDNISPMYWNLSVVPISPLYSPSAIYQFNSTWTDNLVGLGTVILSLNGINYTTSNLGNIYNKTFANLNAGTYNYSWWANDTLGNTNLTQNLTYVINRVASQTSLIFDKISPQNYGTSINASCSIINGTGSPILYRAGADVTLNENNQLVIIGAGTQNYNCTLLSSQNYFGNSNISSIIINQKQGIVNTFLNNSRNNITIGQGTSILLNGTLINGSGLIALYNNGTLINNGLSPINNFTLFSQPGLYNITTYYSGNSNYTASYETYFVNVLYVDSTKPYVTILNPTATAYSTDTVPIEIALNEPGNCLYSLDDGLTNNTLTVNSTSAGFTGTSNSLANGAYTLNAYCSDLSGNRNNTESVGFTINVVTPPTSCFLPGTLIKMSDGTNKVIENVKIGDKILGYDFGNNELVNETVLELESPIREGYYLINGIVKVTDEHPFYTQKQDGKIVWAAINITKAHRALRYSELKDKLIYNLEIGDKLYSFDGKWTNIGSVIYFPGNVKTYNLKTVHAYNDFFADSFLVHNKDGGGPGCTNDCSPAGTTQCLSNGTGYRICGNYDSDSCLEWGPNSTLCSIGDTCSNGQCGQGNQSGNDNITCNLGECVNNTQTNTCINQTNQQIVSVENLTCGPLCTPNWQCDQNWGDCIDGISSRNCIDLNSCNSTINMPNNSLSCTCNPNIQCTDWSTCEYNNQVENVLSGNIQSTGFQTRGCHDLNGCVSSYTEGNSCTSNIKVQLVKENRCGVETLKAINNITGEPITSINLQTWAAKKLDIAFIQNNSLICDTCFNGKQDGDETGIDCGGSCRACIVEGNKDIIYKNIINILWWLITLLLILDLILFFYRRRKDDLEKIRQLIKDGKNAMSENDIGKSRIYYRQMEALYEQLSDKDKLKIYQDIVEYYNLLVNFKIS